MENHDSFIFKNHFGGGSKLSGFTAHTFGNPHKQHLLVGSNRFLSTSISSTSTDTCPICLGTMKAGQGHAIFTGECSHAFHFHCIDSNLKSSATCPVCRAKWNQVPVHGPTTKITPSFPPHGHAQMTEMPEAIIYNDDEPLDLKTEVAEGRNPIRPIDITLHPEVSAIQKSDSKEEFNVLIHLKAPPATSSRTPLDLVTILDVSGSMSGTKIALLKKAMEFVIKNLGPSDRLSVISFNKTAHRLFPLCKMTDSGKQQALRAVKSLTASGGTSIAEGLREGAKVMEERKEINSVSSIILLSDGQDNVHSELYRRRVTQPDYRDLLPFNWRDETSGFRIPVHAFGFGADHDAKLLNSISELSNGTFSFVETEVLIQDAFAQCLGGLLSVVVKNLGVGIKCIHPDIHLASLKAGSYSTMVSDMARSGFINVGDLYADEVRNFLIPVNIPLGDLKNETNLLNVHCVYKDPVSKENFRWEGKDVKIERPDIVTELVVSLEVDREKNRILVAEAMAEAQIAAEEGDYSRAVLILQNIQKSLAETASARAGDTLCAELNAELEEMQERMTSRDMYEKYGRAYNTAALRSHTTQRAATRGQRLRSCYLTPSMESMVSQSRSISTYASPPITTSSSRTSFTRISQSSIPILGQKSSASIDQSKWYVHLLTRLGHVQNKGRLKCLSFLGMF